MIFDWGYILSKDKTHKFMKISPFDNDSTIFTINFLMIVKKDNALGRMIRMLK